MTNEEAVEYFRKRWAGQVTESEIFRAETELKGRKVKAIKDLYYGEVDIPESTIGVIYDFGQCTGTPFIKWSCPQEYKAVADIGKHCVLLDD